MKTIIIIFFFFLISSVNAQGIKVQVWDANGYPRLIDYVPTGVPKNYVDSTNTVLKNYIQVSLTNYQNWTIAQLALKADKGTTGSTPYIINLPANTYVTEIRPQDYGVTYSNGRKIGAFFGQGYEWAPGINFDDAPDVIYQTASYNLDPKGNRITNDGGWWFGRIERHYDVSPQYRNVIEGHVFGFVDYNNISHRSLTVHGSKETGQAYTELEANIFRIRSFINGMQKDLFSVTDGKIQLQNTTNALGLGLYHSTGNSFVIDMDGGGFKITGPGLQIGQGWALKLPITTSTGSIQSKELYVDANGFVKAR